MRAAPGTAVLQERPQDTDLMLAALEVTVQGQGVPKQEPFAF